jgi:hypothetical protein
MKRRQFVLLGSTVIAIVPLASCGDDDDDGDDGGAGTGGTSGSGGKGGTGGTSAAGTGNEAGTGTGNEELCTEDITAESTLDQGHTHDITIPLEDILAAEPGEYDMTLVDNHIHTVDLTAEDFEALLAGDAVTKTSSEDNGHTHDVTLTCV